MELFNFLTSHFSKEIDLSEIEILLKKFKGKSIEVQSINGKIKEIKTNDKDVIAYAKKIGLTKHE